MLFGSDTHALLRQDHSAGPGPSPCAPGAARTWDDTSGRGARPATEDGDQSGKAMGTAGRSVQPMFGSDPLLTRPCFDLFGGPICYRDV